MKLAGVLRIDQVRNRDLVLEAPAVHQREAAKRVDVRPFAGAILRDAAFGRKIPQHCN
jgi:hypothetical protein